MTDAELIIAHATSGEPLPWRATPYTFAQLLLPSDSRLVGLDNPRIQGTLVLENVEHVHVEGLTFVNAPSPAAIMVNGGRAHAILNNEFLNSAGFGIFLRTGARESLIQGNSTFQNGIELIGITYECSYNRVIGNYAEGCGDNGISVSGSYNTVVGNICQFNAKAGIHVWGSFNTLTGNVCTSNNQLNGPNDKWAGIGVSSNYGGCGQKNIIQGNVCDDDQPVPTQFNCIRIGGSAYITWDGVEAVPAGQYRLIGNDVKLKLADGSWRYCSTFLNLQTFGNVVGTNMLGRFKSGATYFASTG